MTEIEYTLKLHNGIFSSYALTYQPNVDRFDQHEISSLKALSEVYYGETNHLGGQADIFKAETSFRYESSEMIDISSNFIRVKTYNLTLAKNATVNDPLFRSVLHEFGINTVPEPGTMTGMLLAIGSFAMPSCRTAT